MKLPSLMKVPSLLLKQLYTFGSLENVDGGVRFHLKNRLSNATLVGLRKIEIGGEEVPLDRVTLTFPGGSLRASEVSKDRAVEFPLGESVEVMARREALAEGKYPIRIDCETDSFGKLNIKVEDGIGKRVERVAVPYDKIDNTGEEIIRKRQRFAEEFSGIQLRHVTQYSFDPKILDGNIENFAGVAQVPIGLAGPLQIHGEHAQGDFVIPLATTEGTLVASYNRGIKVLNLSGGVQATVVDDCMQRAPVFVFESALEARHFRDWVDESLEGIRDAAESTSSVAKLRYIDTYLSNKFAYLRFNYSTGDAAGQNMVGRATFAACSWIMDRVPGILHFYLESNLATDKKASQVNVMRTRGKRVTAEATIPREVLEQHMRVDPETLHYHSNIANVGAFLSGANNNGAHSPNGITAMFIATGQDVANVSESSAGIVYTEVTRADEDHPGGDLYISITIPSLIVATYGGGTGLATQRECLELLGCRGRGKVRKFAEIVAAVALAGEISLASAISSMDWVSSHEKYGRNR
jgi:hydroxymethylglutaryl-CoA reductase (NADPH)